MGRKVFVSVLGTGYYGECRYCKDSFSSSSTRFVQQATLEYLNVKEKWNEGDCIYILLTEKAKSDNWNIPSGERFNREKKINEPYKGLKQIIEEMELPCPVKTIAIPDGRNEEEMWIIFNRLFDALVPNDELFFDLTHSFRYLPMLVLVLGNYARFLKDTSIKYISYGNYEARDEDTNRAPLMDVLPLSILQDWTFAAADLIRNGNVESLQKLSDDRALSPMLRSRSGRNPMRMDVEATLKGTVGLLESILLEFQLCKGREILKGESIRQFRDTIQEFSNDSIVSVMPPIIDRISKTFEGFKEESLQNGYQAAQWCYQHRLYQQSTTILQEAITSAFCKCLDIDGDKYIVRAAAGDYLASGKINENKWKPTEKDSPEGKFYLCSAREKVEETKDKEEVKSFIRVNKADFSWLRKKRNSYNHASMINNNQDAFSEEDLPKLKEIIDRLMK